MFVTPHSGFSVLLHDQLQTGAGGELAALRFTRGMCSPAAPVCGRWDQDDHAAPDELGSDGAAQALYGGGASQGLISDDGPPLGIGDAFPGQKRLADFLDLLHQRSFVHKALLVALDHDPSVHNDRVNAPTVSAVN